MPTVFSHILLTVLEWHSLFGFFIVNYFVLYLCSSKLQLDDMIKNWISRMNKGLVTRNEIGAIPLRPGSGSVWDGMR